VVLWLAIPAVADPYLALRGGPAWWRDTSNGDGVESGTEPGAWGALALGRSWGWLDAEIEASGRWHPLHGRNRGDSHHSADGRHFGLAAVTAGLWPRLELTEHVSVTAGGGAGLAVLTALGDTDAAPLYTAGAAVLVGPVEIGWRYTRAAAVKLDGFNAEYDSHSLSVGVRW
jgi:hypothetical protein